MNNTKGVADLFNKGDGQEVKEFSSGYEQCHVKVIKVSAEVAGSTKVIHPLLDAANAEGRTFLAAWLEITFPSGEVKKHLEVGNAFREDGTPAIYPTYFDKKKGKDVAGTFAYDLVHAIKEYSDEQAKEFDPGWKFSGKIFKDKEFDMDCKLLQNGNVIMKTSRQEIKDEEYAKNRQTQPEDHYGKPEEPVTEIDEDDDMPF